MKREMFGYRKRAKPDSSRVPGQPYNGMGEPEDSEGKEQDNPPGYEGKEHVKYKNPGFTRHNIKYPQDEPHMKGKVGKEEMHEMEDNFHMDTPDQTEDTLPAKIKRARMKMDMPDQEDPEPMHGNLVQTVGSKGKEYEPSKIGEEMGPNDMQSGMSKERRKKMIVAVTKRKMNRNG